MKCCSAFDFPEFSNFFSISALYKIYNIDYYEYPILLIITNVLNRSNCSKMMRSIIFHQRKTFVFFFIHKNLKNTYKIIISFYYFVYGFMIYLKKNEI